MAVIKTEQLKELRQAIYKLSLEADKKLIEDMLNAGTPPVIKAWKKSMNNVIMPRGTMVHYKGVSKSGRHYDYYKPSRMTGESMAMVQGGISYEKTAVGASDVYPRGKRKRGRVTTRNATIAFVLHFGTTKKKQAPTKFVDNATNSSSKECVDNMQKVFDSYLKKKGLV